MCSIGWNVELNVSDNILAVGWTLRDFNVAVGHCFMVKSKRKWG